MRTPSLNAADQTAPALTRQAWSCRFQLSFGLLASAAAIAQPVSDTLRYDERGNIIQRVVAGQVTDYRYDGLDRLREETAPGNQRLVLDADGNRLADGRSTYAVAPGGQRLASRDGVAMVHGPGGHLLADRAWLGGRWVQRQFDWTLGGQIKTVRLDGIAVATYHYNEARQRTRKTLAAPPVGVPAVTLYRHDPAGRLTLEVAGSPALAPGVSVSPGQVLVRYIWQDEVPVAVVWPPMTPGNPNSRIDRIVYLHNDHLNTPRRATDARGVLVWQWISDAFGSSAPQEDPDGDGRAVTIHLRFPGQYFDAESGLHYNWNRYYDPQVGRYTQSDPIGLAGGINTYAYVDSNPLNFTDPTGLDRWGDTMCLPTHVYVVQSSGNGKDGPTWGAAGSASNDSLESPGFMSFPANSFPDRTYGSPGIVSGTYYGTYGSTAHGFPSVGKRGPGIVMNQNKAIPTLGPNPAQGGLSFADYVHMHCQNYGQSRSDTNRGSAGCLTVRGDFCKRLWDMLERQCNKNVIIHVIRN